MLATRGKYLTLALALALGFGPAAPKAFADPEDPMNPSQDVVRARKTGNQTTVPAQQGTPSETQNPDLSPEIQADLREGLDDLRSEVAALRKQMDDMRALEKADKAAYDKGIAALQAEIDQKNKSGIAGGVTKIGNQVDGSAKPTNPNPGETPGRTNPNGTSTNKPATPAAPQPLNFWQKLLLAAMEGIGKGLGRLLDQRFNQIQNKATTVAQQASAKHPNQTTAITNHVNQTVQNAWNRTPANQTVPVVAAPRTVPANQVTGPAQRFYQPVQLLPRNAAGVPVINLELALDRNN